MDVSINFIRTARYKIRIYTAFVLKYPQGREELLYSL